MLLKFGNHSADLREAYAALSRRLANYIVPWDEIRALKAKRLVALNKCPGVRPIGIGEVGDRFLGKIMAYLTNDDVKNACGSDQLCSGVEGGMEGAIHGVKQLFDANCEDGWGLLLVDAANAFNSLSRVVALWNARVIWTRCSRFLFNSYQGYAVLILRGCSSFILSKEGVTQGDPLGMLMYAIGLLPLVQKLKTGSSFLEQLRLKEELDNEIDWKQNWFADDSSCIATLRAALEWLKLLVKEGPKFGYFPEPEKSYLVVHPSQVEKAKQMFMDFQVNVVTGHRLLGGFIGSFDEMQKWIYKKVTDWATSIDCLSKAAVYEPHLVNVSLTRSLQNEWNYVQRVISDVDNPFALLKSSLEESFLPALFGADVDTTETPLMMASAKNGGLGIRNPVLSAALSYQSSFEGTKELSNSIVKGTFFDLAAHRLQMKTSSKICREQMNKLELNEVENCSSLLPQNRQRTLNRIRNGNCSTWLSMMPTHENHFLMSSDVFRDSIALRYGRTPIKMHGFCDGCSQAFDVSHALDCKMGGLVTARHNESRDLNIDLIQQTGLTQTVREPILKEPDTSGKGGLRVDWGVRGFWEFQREALFDICILNADAPSYLSSNLESLFDAARQRKKNKYGSAAEQRKATFTPVIATCEAIFDHEAEVYLKKISALLSSKWETPYSQIHGWVKARMQVCILRSVSLCIRGSRTKWRGAGIEHGAQISSFLGSSY